MKALNFLVAPYAAVGGIADLGTAFDSFFQDTYVAIRKFLFWPAIIALAGCGLTIVISSNPQATERAKNWGLRIFIGIAIAYGAPMIVQAIIKAVEGISGINTYTR